MERFPKWVPALIILTILHITGKPLIWTGWFFLAGPTINFLSEWNQDWKRAPNESRPVCDRILWGSPYSWYPTNRLLADLDSNAWPQTGRDKALHELRKAWAPHLYGDQHLGVVVQHGIESTSDGPSGLPAQQSSIQSTEDGGNQRMKNPVPARFELPATLDRGF